MKIVENIYWYSKDQPVSNFFGRGFSGNVFVLHQGVENWLIDAGVAILGRPQRIMKLMKKDGLDPTKITKIFITHAHPDHINGYLGFKSVNSIVLYIHPREQRLLFGGLSAFWDDIVESSRGLVKEFYPVPLGLAKWFVRYSMGDQPRIDPTKDSIQFIADQEIIHGDNYDLQVIHTPGHTKGHCCYYIPSLKMVFGGDLIDPSFDHKPSLNFPSSDYLDILNSVNKMNALHPEFYCGSHGKTNLIGREICDDLWAGTLKNLEYAKNRTIELLEQNPGMRIKEFYGKFPKNVWLLQDQMCVPYSVIKWLETQHKIQFNDGKFYYLS